MNIDQLNRGGFLIARINQLADRIFSQKLDAIPNFNISSTQSKAIYTLWQEDMISLQELTHKLSLSKSTTSELITQLEQQGYVEKMPCQTDKRKTLLKLNREVIPLEEQFYNAIHEMEQILYQGLDQPTITFFEAVLDKILMNLRSYLKKK